MQVSEDTSWTPEFDLVAYISKTKGLDGRLVAQELGELSVLHAGLEVWVVPPALEGTRHTAITSLTRNEHKTGVVISLEGVTDRSQASALADRYLLARTSDLPKGDLPKGVSTCRPELVSGPPQKLLNQVQHDMSQHDLFEESSEPCLPNVTGTVFADTTYGALGSLESIKEGPAYDIWVIEGPYGHLEIPAVDEYIAEENSELVTLSLPQGFIEITAQNKEGSRHEN